MSKKREPYEQVYDGDWNLVRSRGFKSMCCDCALVHIIDTRVSKNGIEVRVRRDNRATANARRAFHFTKEDE